MIKIVQIILSETFGYSGEYSKIEKGWERSQNLQLQYWQQLVITWVMCCPFTFWSSYWNYYSCWNHASFLLNTIKHLTGHWVFCESVGWLFYLFIYFLSMQRHIVCRETYKDPVFHQKEKVVWLSDTHFFFFCEKNKNMDALPSRLGIIKQQFIICVHNLLPSSPPPSKSKYFGH